MLKHGYGYKPSKADRRDFTFTATGNVKLPPSVDLRDHGLVSPVIDQGQLGSCTGCSIVALREHLDLKAGKPLTKLSELFVYWQERALEHTISQDAGAEPRDGFKVLQKIGVAPETDDPYNIKTFTKAPSNQAITDAANFKIGAYHRITTLNSLKSCLAGGTGAVLGFTVYSSFEDNQVLATRGIMPMPQPGEQVVGGHAVFAVGYFSDSSYQGGGYLVIKNSWSADWGNQGYFNIPFAFVTKANCSDIWTAAL